MLLLSTSRLLYDLIISDLWRMGLKFWPSNKPVTGKALGDCSNVTTHLSVSVTYVTATLERRRDKYSRLQRGIQSLN